LNNKDYKV